VTIRKAAMDDIDAIAYIESECILSPWSREMIADELSRDDTVYLIAEDEGVAMGFIGASLIIDTADITNVAVLDDFRKRGVGFALVSAMAKELSSRGALEILLEVRSESAPARALYEKTGFEVISTRRRYYKDPTDDALIMRRDI